MKPEMIEGPPEQNANVASTVTLEKIDDEKDSPEEKDKEEKDKEKKNDEKEEKATGTANISNSMRVYAKMEANFQLSNKCAIFYNMRRYYLANERDPFQVLPVTFHIKSGDSDSEYRKFTTYYNDLEKQRSMAVTEDKELQARIERVETEIVQVEEKIK